MGKQYINFIKIQIREVNKADFDGLMNLYMQLHNNHISEKTPEIMELWNRIINDKDYHIIIAGEDGKIISSCVCVIIPNLTDNQQPYAFVENVVTEEAYRGKGLATKCLNYAKEIALRENCYKLMLLTGSKKDNTLNFYRQAGYNSEDKTGFVCYLRK